MKVCGRVLLLQRSSCSACSFFLMSGETDLADGGKDMADWIFILMITITPASQTTSKMTEAQCKSAVAEIEDLPDPIMAFCIGPAGERIRTTPVRERIAKWQQRQSQSGALSQAPAKPSMACKGEEI